MEKTRWCRESREEEPYLTVGGSGAGVTENFPGEVKVGQRLEKQQLAG